MFLLKFSSPIPLICAIFGMIALGVQYLNRKHLFPGKRKQTTSNWFQTLKKVSAVCLAVFFLQQALFIITGNLFEMIESAKWLIFFTVFKPLIRIMAILSIGCKAFVYWACINSVPLAYHTLKIMKWHDLTTKEERNQLIFLTIITEIGACLTLLNIL